MTQKKMGRPTDDPKTKSIQFRLSEKDLSILEEYCRSHSTTYSEVIRNMIHLLAEKE